MKSQIAFQIVLGIIFIIVIILITNYYIKKNKEPFETKNDLVSLLSITPNTTPSNTPSNTQNIPNETPPDMTLPNATPPDMTSSQQGLLSQEAEFAQFEQAAKTAQAIKAAQEPKPTIQLDTSDINIGDDTIKSNLIKKLNSINDILNRYAFLDSPISINNDGKQCSSWGTYNNSKYAQNDNNCMIVPESNYMNRQCLVGDALSSCSNYYDNGTVDKNNNIDIKTIMNAAKSKMLVGISSIMNDLNMKNGEIDKYLNDLIAKRSLENQQLQFIKHNTSSLDDKDKLFNKASTELNKIENDININQVNFSQFLSLNNDNDANSSFYYKIIIGLIIVIIIVGIMNLLFTNLDEI